MYSSVALCEVIKLSRLSDDLNLDFFLMYMSLNFARGFILQILEGAVNQILIVNI